MRAQVRPGSPYRRSLLLALAFGALAFLALVIPSELALRNASMLDLRVPGTLGALAMIAIVYAMFGNSKAGLATGLAGILLFVMLFVRFLFLGLTEFSGSGFTDDVFIHLEPESFRVAWNQYRSMILGSLAMLAALVVVLLALTRRMARPSSLVALLIALPAAILAAGNREALPEWMLVQSVYEWYQPKRLDMPAEEQQRWRESGLVQVDLTKKSDIIAKLPASPRNLILLYIESGGLRVIDPPKYPGLMPNLARLVREHSLVPSIHASSYITIEGLVNSQCGTLFPFERESESLTGLDGAAEEMPCLGDVLHEAGYLQTYLGGAGLSFAGKGNFLRAHGYDKQMGVHEWAALGLHQRPDTWGLSDADLFEQSLLELAALRQSGKPFNLTLLTIGTHLPGFFYEECAPYGAGKERFLNALHCTDQLIERWLDRLETEGYLNDSLVVITGDHHVFPNPEMQRLFGKEAIDDRRLPFIVLGNGANRSSTQDGAGFDLAPTILDLLGIEHNAYFALGRSLLGTNSPRNYFVSRFIDIFDGAPVDPAHGPCSDVTPPTPPLNICDKKSLLTLLRIQNAAFSQPAVRLNCDRAERTRISIPYSTEQPMQLMVDGIDQALRFSWMERTLRESEPGLYMIGFDRSGNLVRREFYPEQEPLTQTTPLLSSDKIAATLAIWRSADTSRRPPDWLLTGNAEEKAMARFFSADGSSSTLQQAETETGIEFVLNRDTCTRLVPSP